MHVCWSHGKESGPDGSKIMALVEVARKTGFDAVSLDYRGLMDPEARVSKLLAHLAGVEGPVILAGSSMGGYVSVVAAYRRKVQGVFLLAPALGMPGYEIEDPGTPAPVVTTVHGWRDEIIPFEHSVRYLRSWGGTLHLIDGDHRLRENVPELERYFAHFLEIVAGWKPSASEKPGEQQ